MLWQGKACTLGVAPWWTTRCCRYASTYQDLPSRHDSGLETCSFLFSFMRAMVQVLASMGVSTDYLLLEEFLAQAQGVYC